MRFLSNVSDDIRLRNLTIYAQWLSIVGVVVAWITELSFVLEVFAAYELPLIYKVKSSLLLTLYPLAPLALELPHFVPRVPLLYLSMASWLFPMPLWTATHVGDYDFDFAPGMFLAMAMLGVSNFVFHGIYVQPFPGTGVRVGMYIVYTETMAFWIGPLYPNPITKLIVAPFPSLCASGIFFCVLMLYTIAWLKGHIWVFSKTLGGTGIGAMALMLPGQGPMYEFIGDEAEEGRIQLV